jgi:hypothetical protein
MLRLAGLLLSCLVTTAAVQGSVRADPVSEEQAVALAFKRYQEAVLANAGSVAADLVTPATLAYYEKMKRTALHAPASEVKALPLADKIVVLNCRQRLSSSDLQSMSASKLFAHAVEDGWFDKNAAVRLSLGKVTVRSHLATARATSEGKEAPFSFRFERVSGKWKLDLTPFMRFVSVALRQMLRAAGTDEDQFIFDSLEATTGTKVTDSIWDPMIRRLKI